MMLFGKFFPGDCNGSGVEIIQRCTFDDLC